MWLSFDSLDPSLLTDIVVQAAPASSLLVDIVDTVEIIFFIILIVASLLASRDLVFPGFVLRERECEFV